jgi:hypothetical protein
MDNDVMIWFFGMYVLGTIIGYRWGFKRGAFSASEKAIDSLIEQGVIKTSVDADGVTQIHKFDE